MTKLFQLLLVLLLVGCASAGKRIGQTGNGILMASGASIVLIPVGVVLGVPLLVLATPVYYGGCAISGDKPEERPFDL